MTSIILKPGYTLRSATWDDLEPVTQLIYDVCLEAGDTDNAYSVEELRDAWETPDFDLETDIWVVTNEDGHVVGYEELYNRSEHATLLGDGYVHPDFMGKGIGTALLRTLEKRALEHMKEASPNLRVYIRNGMSIEDTIARELHEVEGYKPVRFYWRMEIKLEEMRSKATWPEGIELRPFDEQAHAQLVYNAHMEAFRDQWGFSPLSFEVWKDRLIESSEYNPELWCIAWDGDEIAGYAICHYRMGNGWVESLGVCRPWRKRGLGTALLNKAFETFKERGTEKVSLGVDAASQTGAT